MFGPTFDGGLYIFVRKMQDIETPVMQLGEQRERRAATAGFLGWSSNRPDGEKFLELAPVQLAKSK